MSSRWSTAGRCSIGCGGGGRDGAWPLSHGLEGRCSRDWRRGLAEHVEAAWEAFSHSPGLGSLAASCHAGCSHHTSQAQFERHGKTTFGSFDKKGLPASRRAHTWGLSGKSPGPAQQLPRPAAVRRRGRQQAWPWLQGGGAAGQRASERRAARTQGDGGVTTLVRSHSEQLPSAREGPAAGLAARGGRGAGSLWPCPTQLGTPQRPIPRNPTWVAHLRCE